MDWNQQKVLVTGAGGFIGSHLAERLVEIGASVRAFVHYNALGKWGWLDASPYRSRMQVIAGDITDRDSVVGAMEGMNIVFHLAALITIPYSYRAPQSYAQANIIGTMHVLEGARQLGIEKLIHTSTSEVYGTARTVPITEDHPLQGQSPYSASKIGADKMAEAFHCSFGVPVVTIRPFNTFGPRQSARAVIPAIIAQCLAGRERIELGNLSPTRDMNYVGNTVDGFIAAAESEQALGRTIHLGSGREISIGQLAETIRTLTGSNAEIVSSEERMRPDLSEVDRLVADNTLARDVLGWSPRIDFEEGLERTITWMRGNMDMYRPETYMV